MSDPQKMTINEAEAILETRVEAGAEEIRAAYLAQVRLYPPDRAPDRFEKIRDAYKLLSDPHAKAGRVLESENPLAPFPDFVDRRAGAGSPFRFVGPAPWLAVMAERGRKG